MPITSHAAPEERTALSTDDLLALYRSILCVTPFENAPPPCTSREESQGSLHLSVGQKTVPAGTCFALASDRAAFADTHTRVGVLPSWGCRCCCRRQWDCAGLSR